MSIQKSLKLGAMLHGVGIGWDNWKHPDAVADAGTNLKFYIDQIKTAEKAKFDFAFIADSVYITPHSTPHYLNRFEPISLLSTLSAVTSRIGLVATITVSYNEPFNVARQLASLDQLSGGRAGWNIVTSFLEGTAANFSRKEHYPHNVRYRLAQEFLDVAKGLWDSWEDDAFTRNKESGVFYQEGKLHELHHQGEFFSVKGPLNIARSKQGHPVIFQAGMSEDGRNYAAKNAEGIYSHGGNLEAAKLFYQDIKKRAAAFGRSPEEISVFPGISPVIGQTEEEAERKYQEKLNLITIENALIALGRPFNYHDFSQYDLDAPFPELGDLGKEAQQNATENIKRRAKERNLTLRQVALEFSMPRSPFIGTPEKVADLVQQWFEEGACDGFLITPDALPTSLEDFSNLVVPILQERGLFRKEYAHDTFRENFGLKIPENCYSKVVVK